MNDLMVAVLIVFGLSVMETVVSSSVKRMITLSRHIIEFPFVAAA